MGSYLSIADRACFTCPLSRCRQEHRDCPRNQLLLADPANGLDAFGNLYNKGPLQQQGSPCTGYDEREQIADVETRYSLNLPNFRSL